MIKNKTLENKIKCLNKIYNKMSKTHFNEKIDCLKAKYLLSLNDDEIKSYLNPDGKSLKGESMYCDIDVYLKQLKIWLKTSIKKIERKGSLLQTYNHSSKMIDNGRIFVKGFGVQRLKKTVRGFLIDNLCYDVDMKNAHPSILYNIIKTDYPQQLKNFKLFEEYVLNRDEFMRKNNINKLDVLVALNSNKYLSSTNKTFIKLDRELKNIQYLIFTEYENKNKELPSTILANKATLKQNKEGRYINSILCYHENLILQRAMELFGDKVHTPMFDGFTVDYSVDKDEILEKLNNLTKNEHIIWDIKPHDNSIVMPEDFTDTSLTVDKTYSEQKEDFEKTHFIIENPLLFGREYTIEGEQKYQFYAKERFRDLVKPIKYFDFEMAKNNGNPTVEFFPKWLGDIERRSYKEMRFVPKINDSEEYYNSFQGFEFQETLEEDEEVIKTFTDHIKLLTDYDEKATEYLIKYIAHILQKPYELPKTAIILKSKQGYGKDTLIDIIERLIGKKHVFRTADLDDVFGQYNVGIRDRLLLQLNEVEGKTGYANKEKLKNMITEQHSVIREKYISQYDQINYIRLWILSNNLNPIEISYDDRRFAVFKAHHKKPSKEYFDRLHNMKDNDNEMNVLFNYLMKMDINEFSPPIDRPLTEAYENMKQHNQNPIYQFLWDCFVDNNGVLCFESGTCMKNKKTGFYYCKSETLFRKYKQFLEHEEKGYITPTYKMIKSILGDIGVLQKKCKVNKTTQNFYIIDPDSLREQLQDMGLDEATEELGDDDFEEVFCESDEGLSDFI